MKTPTSAELAFLRRRAEQTFQRMPVLPRREDGRMTPESRLRFELSMESILENNRTLGACVVLRRPSGQYDVFCHGTARLSGRVPVTEETCFRIASVSKLVMAFGVLALCEELGIGFVPYSPLNRGFLGGMINEYTRFDTANDNRQTLPRFQPEAIRANTRIVVGLNAFGRTRGITTAQVALAWLLNRRPFIVPIPGTTKLSHLEENLRACDIVFTSEEVTELEKAVAAIPVVGSRYDALQESKIQK